MAAELSNDYILKIGSGTVDAVGCANNIGWDLQRGTIETTCFDDAGAASYVPGITSETFSVDGFFKLTNPVNPDDIDLFLRNGVEIDWTWGKLTPVAGDIVYSGKGIITNLTRTLGVGEAVTYSFGVQVTGEVTRTPTP